VERPPNNREFDPTHYLSGRATWRAPNLKAEAPLEDKKAVLKVKGDSADSPICIDLDLDNPTPIKSPSPPIRLPKSESPGYIEISDSEDSVLGSISAASTRLPSPSGLHSPTISALFQELQATHHDLDFLPFISRLRAFGIRFTAELFDRNAEWLVNTVRMPLEEAALTYTAALEYKN
jgi:hypothetical protein